MKTHYGTRARSQVVFRAGSDTTVRLKERKLALERELSDEAAGAERVRKEAEVVAEQNLIHSSNCY